MGIALNKLTLIHTIANEIKDEIEWCILNQKDFKKELSKDFIQGFIKGLNQALLLINATEEHLKNEGEI